MSEKQGDQSDISYLMPFIEHAASMSAVVVEIGCGNGNGSTRALARGIARSGAPDKLFVTVDIEPDNPADKPELAYWHLVHGPSESEFTLAAVEQLLAGRMADLIFIDTIHTYDHLAKEHLVWDAIADNGTTWLYHDTWIWGPYNSMTDAAKQYAESHGLVYEDVSRLSHGLGMVSLAGHPDWPRPQGVDSECPKL